MTDPGTRRPASGLSNAMQESLAFFRRRQAERRQQDPPALAQLREAFSPGGRRHPVPADVTLTAVDAGGVPAHWLTAPQADPGHVLFYLHGGGYRLGSLESHGELAARLGRALGRRVLLPEYRLAPEHPFPAALHDAEAAWRWLTAGEGIAPDKVVIAGDSAGGGLALALMIVLRDAGDALPPCAALLSPWADVSRSGASMRLRAAEDPVLTPDAVRGLARDYLGGGDPRQPLASPLFAPLQGLPALLVQVGGAEVLFSDASRLAEAARAAGVTVELQTAPGLPHVYQSLLGTPEADAAVEAIRAFAAGEGGAGAGADGRPAAAPQLPAAPAPARGRAVRFDAYGGREVLYLAEAEVSAPTADEVTVAVRAAAINPGEALIRQGAAHARYPATFPSGQGSDLAGVVCAAGSAVGAFGVGDEVLGWSWRRSSHADYVTVPASQLVRKPAGLSWEIAGSLYVAGATAYAAVDAVDPRSGETVVVSAAAGGVGSIVVQLLRLLGVQVVGIASAASHPWLLARGVTPVAYGDDLLPRVRAAAPAGVDAFIDLFGPQYLRLAVALGVPPARIETIIARAAAQQIGARTAGSADATSTDVLGNLAHLAASAQIEVPVAATYPLDRVREAFAQLEQRHTHGKIVLLPAPAGQAAAAAGAPG